MRRLCSTIVLAALFAGAAFAANPHDPQKRFTAADQAWARTLLLQRADLPGAGWTSKKSTGDNSTCKSFNPDESKLVETGEQQSREFSRGGGFVTSMAAIFKTTKDAETGWNLEAKTQILDCLAEALGQTSTGSATVKIAARGRLAFPHVAQRTAAFYVRLAFNVQGIKFNADLHFILLGRGRANLALMSLSPGKPLTPLPAGLDRSLAATLARRLSG
ncbi:MAG: hypothetical protein E6G64_03905 [Actinobacteria bacterium]|nr:MAG: hypothetical protein E6G64_03905 [Actinomycetota bacterium]